MKSNPSRQAFRTSLCRLLALFLVFGFYGAPAAERSNKPVVKTGNGKIRGVLRASGGAEFLGIPYAHAPLGELRWHEPVPIGKWRDVRDATSFGAPCAQPVLGDWNKHDAETSKENCLFLNVITPVWPPKQPLPVMFWLHGRGTDWRRWIAQRNLRLLRKADARTALSAACPANSLGQFLSALGGVTASRAQGAAILYSRSRSSLAADKGDCPEVF